MVHSPGSGDPGDWLTFIVEVQENGSPASGQTVTFSITPDNGTLSFLGGTSTYTTGDNGRVAQTLVLGSDASGSYTVTASVGSVSVSRTATVETPPLPPEEGGPPTRTLYRVESVPFHPGDTVTFMASVRQVKGGVNQGVSGETVTFSLSPDDGTASLSTTSVTTDSNGEARTTLTLGSSASGSYRVTATFGDGTSKTHSTGTVETSPPQDDSGEDQPESEEQPTSDSQEDPKSDSQLESLSVTIDDVTSAAERGRMTFTVRLEPTPTAPTTVKYATASQTAKAGQDYEVATGTLHFGANQNTATFTVRIRPDEQAEPNETFAVRITHPSTRALLAEATGTITDDDGEADEPQARLTPDPSAVAFSADDPAWKTFTVHTSLDSVLVRANPSGSDPAIEVSGGQQAPTRDYCPAEGNDRPTSGRRDGWNLHVKACQAGQTKILLIDYDTGEVVQQYEVNVKGSGIAATTALNPSYPNPFNSETVLSYTLPTAADIRLEVFTLSGQRVAVLHEGFQAAGYHTLSLDAAGLASGVYLYRLTTPEGRFARKFTLLR